MTIATAAPQTTTGTPAIMDAPAPWTLRGRAYILVVKMPEQALANCAFTPTTLRKSRHSPLSLAMLVDYESSPAGPYQELLFIPGTFDFNGERHPSISRIFVSTMDSVFNGRRNWGIPKDRCDFRISWQEDGVDQAKLTADDGSHIASLLLAARGPSLPMPGHWLPAGLRTLSQLWEGKQYTLAPSARGRIRRARLLDWHFDAAHFPDLAHGRCVAAFQIPSFEMIFPEPTVRTWRG